MHSLCCVCALSFSMQDNQADIGKLHYICWWIAIKRRNSHTAYNELSSAERCIDLFLLLKLHQHGSGTYTYSLSASSFNHVTVLLIILLWLLSHYKVQRFPSVSNGDMSKDKDRQRRFQGCTFIEYLGCRLGTWVNMSFGYCMYVSLNSNHVLLCEVLSQQ